MVAAITMVAEAEAEEAAPFLLPQVISLKPSRL
jgi:hypothetical protein